MTFQIRLKIHVQSNNYKASTQVATIQVIHFKLSAVEKLTCFYPIINLLHK